jgi:hypothetical protein
MANGPYHVGVLNKETGKYEIINATGEDEKNVLITASNAIGRVGKDAVQIFKEISYRVEIKLNLYELTND